LSSDLYCFQRQLFLAFMFLFCWLKPGSPLVVTCRKVSCKTDSQLGFVFSSCLPFPKSVHLNKMFYTSNGLILSVVRLTFLGPCFYSAVTNDVAGRSDLGILP
jgi:hypothetical protein